MYEFWYDCVKPKYGEKAKLCCMDTDSFIVYVKKQIFIKTLQKMLKLDLILQIMNQIDHCKKKKKKKGIGLMKDESGRKIMTKFVGLRAKTYSYLIENASEDKKAKATKKCVIKRKLKFENFKNCLEATQLENKKTFLKKIKLTYIVFKKS